VTVKSENQQGRKGLKALIATIMYEKGNRLPDAMPVAPRALVGIASVFVRAHQRGRMVHLC
jgi:hypothetical protein